ncbi:MAG: hypothetical protein IPL84_04010 [Chitinophagaceae bacterium]|nr:hypothetical protein [Chitinophagaceae bacterium]
MSREFTGDAYGLILSFITLDPTQKLQLKKKVDAKMPFFTDWNECKGFIHKQADNMVKGIEEIDLVAYNYGSYGPADGTE